MTKRSLGMPRRGYTLLELTISLVAAVILMAGMASAVAVSARSLSVADAGNRARADSTDVQRDLMADLQRATGFTERTPTAVTFTVPDRTGDGRPEALRYAWGGSPGSSLTLQMNGGTVQTVAENVQNFALSYRTQSLVAPTVPDESPVVSGRVLFVTGPPGLAPTFGVPIGGTPGNPVSETSRDPKISLLQSWAFEVTTIAADRTQPEFDAAIAQNDVIYLSSDPGVSQAAPRLANLAVGIVNENIELTEPLGFYPGAASVAGTDTTIGITGHYITQSYSSRQTLRLLTGGNLLQSFQNPKAMGLSILGVVPSTDTVSFATLAAGRRRFDGLNAPGRRVQLPWATANFNSAWLTADARALLKSSLLWAAGNGSDGNPSATTFGLTNSNANATSVSSPNNLMHASKFTLAARGELMELSAYVRARGLPLRLAIYSNSGGAPSVRLAQTNVLTGEDNDAWITGAVTPVVLEPGTYWLAVALSASSQRAYCDDPLTGVTSQISQRPFSGGFPATWTHGSGGSTTTLALKQLLMYGSILTLP
jgi:hypothetical protein